MYNGVDRLGAPRAVCDEWRSVGVETRVPPQIYPLGVAGWRRRRVRVSGGSSTFFVWLGALRSSPVLLRGISAMRQHLFVVLAIFGSHDVVIPDNSHPDRGIDRVCPCKGRRRRSLLPRVPDVDHDSDR